MSDIQKRVLAVMTKRMTPNEIAKASACSIEETIGALHLMLSDGLVGGVYTEDIGIVWYRT